MAQEYSVATVIDVEATFDEIVRGGDLSEIPDQIHASSGDEPAIFGQEFFVPGSEQVEQVDPRRIASLTSTGYSGNNTEESC